MKHVLWLKSLFRSPVRTIVTWVLLLAAAFQFTLSLTDYLSTQRGLTDAKERMKGVLSLEHFPAFPGKSSTFGLFLYTDPTASETGIEDYQWGNYHPQRITVDELDSLTAIPGVVGFESRGMTAGISKYTRPDSDIREFLYEGRLILEATVGKREPVGDAYMVVAPNMSEGCDTEASCIMTLEDICVLGGNQDALPLEKDGSGRLLILAIDEKMRDETGEWWYGIQPSGRVMTMILQNRLYADDLARLETGRRYVFVVRVDPQTSSLYFPQMALGDETLTDWWPYYTDITDLPPDYLDDSEFAPLRELIRVTDDDWNTMDVIYTGDMSVIRRVADLRLVPAQGRFLEPEDIGKPVCVVNEDFAHLNGLNLGDTIELRLGDYPMEQHEVLGAVASTHGRFAKNWTEQEFTVIGTWRDINQGKYERQDLSWAYSDVSIFVPSSFLPEGAKQVDYAPGEVSLLVDAGAMESFAREQIPLLQEAGWITYWNDRGWPQMEEELVLVVQAALYKLLAFAAATLFVIALTVYLFIGRRRADYAILRALGMGKSDSRRSLTLPLLLLTLTAVIPGAAVALLQQWRHEARVDWISLAGIPVLLILTMLLALLLVRRMGKQSPLTLLQSRRKK